jgi:hypothetical protein
VILSKTAHVAVFSFAQRARRRAPALGVRIADRVAHARELPGPGQAAFDLVMRQRRDGFGIGGGRDADGEVGDHGRQSRRVESAPPAPMIAHS